MIGDGDPGEVVIEAKAVMSRCSRRVMGWIANLTLRQGGGKGIWLGVDIAQGRLHLEGCDITSQSIACVGIRGGADPRLLRNRIHDGKMLAAMWTTTARGALEDNDQRFFGRGNQDGVRSAAIKTVGAPIPSLAVGVISEVDHRLALWKNPCWPSYRRAVGPKPEGRTRPSEAVADRGYSRNSERTEQSAPERKFCREA
jgi:hypothetical protein